MSDGSKASQRALDDSAADDQKIGIVCGNRADNPSREIRVLYDFENSFDGCLGAVCRELLARVGDE